MQASELPPGVISYLHELQNLLLINQQEYDLLPPEEQRRLLGTFERIKTTTY